jgi:WD40 repeat protein
MNLEQLISTADLQSFKQLLRKPDINEADLKSLLANINERIKQFQNETKKYKSNLLMNEGIYFEKHEKSISFGKLHFYSEEYKMLSNNFGQLIQSFKINKSSYNSIQVDENSKKLITASSPDREIKIWDLETGKCLKTLTDHKDWVTCILIIPNNKFVSGFSDETIKIWDLNSFECLNILNNESSVSFLCLISEKQIACGCFDGSVKIWDLISLTKINSFEAHNDQISCLLLVDKTKLVSCSVWVEKIKIWNLENFNCIKKLRFHSDVISYLELTSDGNLLRYSFNQTVKFWQIETGQLIKSIKFTDTVCCVKILNEHLLAVGLFEGQIQIYNFKNNKIVIKIPAHYLAVWKLLLLKNGCLLSQSIDYEIKIWKILDD